MIKLILIFIEDLLGGWGWKVTDSHYTSVGYYPVERKGRLTGRLATQTYNTDWVVQDDD